MTASYGLLRNWCQNTVKEFGSTSLLNTVKEFGSTSSLPIEKAMASICLVTMDDGVWASGVLLNNEGLILTNAHLLEPWRFRKTLITGYGDNHKELPFLAEGASSVRKGFENMQQGETGRCKMTNLHPFSTYEQGGHRSNSNYYRHKNIRVRLDHVKPCFWCNAKVVYVCKGPWDVALLQLESIPDQLAPVLMDFSWPSMGSKAYVIGHGLFGPRCGMLLVILFISFWLYDFLWELIF